MMTLITKIDYLSLDPKVYVEGKENRKTCIGGLLSVLTIILSIMGSYYFGQEVWMKKNPVVNQSIESLQEPPTLKLDKESWDIMFALQNDNSFFNDPRVYTVEASTFHVQPNNTLILKKINMENCLEESFSETLYPYFKNYNVKNLVCISKKQEGYENNTLTIQKQFGQADFKLLLFLFKPCQNSTSSSIICESPEDIQKKIGTTYFSLFTIDNFTRTKNLTHPFVKYTYNNFIATGIGSLYTISLYLNHKTITSDMGILFYEEKVIKSFGVNEFKMNYNPKSAEDGTFLRLEVHLKSVQDNIFRKYLKLQELMAQIGGIFNLVNIISKIIIYFINHFYYKVYLVDMFFNYYEVNDENIDYSLIKPTKIVSNNKETLQTNSIFQNKSKLLVNNSNLRISMDVSNIRNNNQSDFINEIRDMNNFHNTNILPNFQGNNDIVNPIAPFKICKEREIINLKPISFTIVEIMKFICTKSNKKIFVDHCFEIIKTHLSVENLIYSDRITKTTNYFTLSEEAKSLLYNVEKYSNLILNIDTNSPNIKKEDKALTDLYKTINSNECIRKKEKKQDVIKLTSKSQNKLNLAEELLSLF